MTRTTRREFLQTHGGRRHRLLGGRRRQPEDSRSPNEKIRFACIGVGGKGTSDSADAPAARRHGRDLRRRRRTR